MGRFLDPTSRESLPLGRWTFDARFGVSLPTGQTVDDPFQLGDQGLPHEHIQLGIGTVAPMVGFEARRAFDKWGIGGFVLAQPVLYADAQGYRAGDRYGAGATAQSGFGLERWIFQLGASVQGELPERWHGAIPTEEGNRGRVDLLASGGVVWRIADAVQLYATLRVPVYVYVSGAQLSYPAIGTLGVTGYYDLFGEHEYHHHHDQDEQPAIARR